MASIAPTDRGAIITCTDSVTLEVKFYTPEIVRITLVRPDDPEPLLTDALLADSLLPQRYVSAIGRQRATAERAANPLDHGLGLRRRSVSQNGMTCRLDKDHLLFDSNFGQ
ncbi:MAG: hypothetical protein IPP40_16505 [bacterium]|nr:hypothetical protein [bacterium]